MSQSPRSLPAAVALKPCGHHVGCTKLGSRLQQLNAQAIGALTLALGICLMIGGQCLEPRDLRLHGRDACREGGDVACPATTCPPGFMSYVSEIDAHQRLAVI